MMKKLSMLALALGFSGATLVGQANVAHALSTFGTVTFIGTTGQEAVDGGLGTTFRIRVHGTCDKDSVVKDRWVIVHSQRTDGANNHNDIATRNAYSTLTAAFLSGRTVQIDGMDTCDNSVVSTLRIPYAQVGMF